VRAEIGALLSETAVERFSGWLSSDVASALRAHGFTKTGPTFHRRGPDGWGVINFQKSQFGSRHDVRFFINVAVALDRLQIVEGRDPSRRPPEHQCNWRVRIGALTDNGEPGWRDIDERTDLDRLTAEIVPILIDRAVPFIEARLTEEGFVTAAKDVHRGAAIRPPVPVILATLGSPVDHSTG
jgi:hypothetical protein